MDPMSDNLDRLDAELSGRRSWLRIDPGLGAMGAAVGVLGLLGAVALPWIGPTSGWELLISLGDPAPGVGLLPRLFVVTAVLVGVVGSAAALLTRLWALGWVCALGCGFSVVTGVWAVWSRQTAPPAAPGPGLGLVLTLLVTMALTVVWVRIAWSRPGGRAGGA
ncbi:MAG: Rv2732c family membrane protein [Pseudonocardia sp.]